MEIGIFSDVHDNLVNLAKVLKLFRDRNIDVLIFCGDFCSPIPARQIGAYNGEIHCVFGNGDGDRFMLGKLSDTEFPNLKIYGEYADLEIEKARIAITHYPFYGVALACTGNYNAVFSGHTHEVHQEYINNCLFANPGEVLGAFGSPTCGVYNTISNEIEISTI